MPRRMLSMVLLGALFSTAPLAHLARAQTAPATPDGKAEAQDVTSHALAERIASMAMALLRAPELSQTQWQYAGALLEAASRLNPNDARLARYVAEAATRAGDADTAIAALGKYLALRHKANQPDHFAWVELMELYLGRMESADEKARYLQRLVETAAVPDPVRAVAAVRASQIFAERMQNEQAHQMIDQALKFNPLNLDALRIRFSTRPPQQPDQRMSMLLLMLQSNPAQPQIGISIARELAQVGLARRSVDWFEQSLDLHRRMGIAPPQDVGIDYAAELYLLGDAPRAAHVADLLIQQNPDDLNAWLLKLILAKHTGNKEELDKVIQQANVVLSNRLAMIRKASGDESATTRPVTATDAIEFPDPSAELQRLVKAGHRELVPQFASLAAALAWEKIYFEEKPAPAQAWINTLAQLMAPDDDVLLRLQGWSYLMAGNKEEARTRLQTVADTDPIAALGLVQLADDDPQAQEKATHEASQILARNPSGLTGALIYQATNKRGVKLTAAPAAADVEKVLSEFPKEWMRILDQAQAFYALRLDPAPGSVGVQVGEPVLVQVTIQNINKFPLTLGPEGVVRQDLWFDAQLRGAQQQVFPAEAYHRFGGPLVLQPGESFKQIVRLDQRALAQYLEYPITSFQITAVVITNPTTMGGHVTIGPGGNRATLSKMIERTGASINHPQVQQRLMTAMQSGSPEEKVRALEIWAKLARLLSADRENQMAQQIIGQALEAMQQGTVDSDPAVRSWATYLITVLTQRKEAAATMRDDPLWLMRLMGVLVTDYVGASREGLKEMAQSDPDPLLQRLAAAAAVAPIVKPPTTAPADGPAVTTTAEPAASVERAPEGTAPPAPPAPIVPPAPTAPETSVPPITPIPESPAPPTIEPPTPQTPTPPPPAPSAPPTPAPEAPTPAPETPAPDAPAATPTAPEPAEPAIPPPPEF